MVHLDHQAETAIPQHLRRGPWDSANLMPGPGGAGCGQNRRARGACGGRTHARRRRAVAPRRIAGFPDTSVGLRVSGGVQ